MYFKCCVFYEKKIYEWKIKLGPDVLQFRISVPEFENQKLETVLKFQLVD